MFPIRTSNELESEFPLSLPPTLDVRAPEGSINRTTAPRCVFGMPLTYEWIEYRYQMDVVRKHKEGEELMDNLAFTWHLSKQLIDEMRPIFGVIVTTTLVKANVSSGTVPVLVIGRPKSKPTQAQMDEAVEVFMRWDFMEVPRWFPDYRILC